MLSWLTEAQENLHSRKQKPLLTFFFKDKCTLTLDNSLQNLANSNQNRFPLDFHHTFTLILHSVTWIWVYSSHKSISSGESSTSHESGSSQVSNCFFFSFFFFHYSNDVRAVTKNINFPDDDIFHSLSKEPLPLRIAVASPSYTTTFNINTFSKNIRPQICTYLKNMSYLPDITEKQMVKGIEKKLGTWLEPDLWLELDSYGE